MSPKVSFSSFSIITKAPIPTLSSEHFQIPPTLWLVKPTQLGSNNLTKHKSMNLTTLPKGMAKWTMMSWPRLPMPFLMDNIPFHNVNLCCDFKEYLSNQRSRSLWCGARRQIRYQDEDEDEDGDDEYGHNEEISKLEFYSQSARGEALIVHALVDQNEVEVLIFKGFSSSLSYGTSPDPTRSILPARAVITSIDRIKGPFDPANIEYLQKDVPWEEFKTNLLSN